jgi:hypothetical protein
METACLHAPDHSAGSWESPGDGDASFGAFSNGGPRTPFFEYAVYPLPLELSRKEGVEPPFFEYEPPLNYKYVVRTYSQASEKDFKKI